MKIFMCVLFVIVLFAAAFVAYPVADRIAKTQRRKKRNRDEAAFSLVEALICICIVLTLAGLAIPSLLSSRQRANEADAAAAVKTLITSETAYYTQYGNFSPDLTSLGNTDLGTSCLASTTQACLIDGFLASGSRSGYSFVYIPSVADYWIVASPIGNSGVNSFCAGSDGIIRANPSGTCTTASPAIQ